MSHKEISAWVMAISAVVISVWVAWEVAANGLAPTPAEAAVKMLWAIGYSIAFNIFAVIIGVIVVSIVRREEVRDERADERDNLIAGRAMGMAYLVLSVSIAGVLIWQALGLEANVTPYALFAASMLAGGTFAVSQLVLYRVS